MSSDRFRKDVDKIKKKFEDLENAAETAIGKGVARFGKMATGAMSELADKLRVVARPWLEHVQIMENYRKEAGLTQNEIAEFSSQVISSSARYGVALNRVASMATFVSKGLGRARGDAIELSAAMADLGDVTNLTDETAKNLSFTFFRQFSVSSKEAVQLSYALSQQARDAHVPLEDLASVLATNSEALRALPLKDATKDLGALSVGMLEQGATTQQVEDLISKFGDTSSRVYKVFIGTGSSVEKTVGTIAERVSYLRDQQRKGILDHMQYEVNLSRLGQTFDLSRFQLEKMADSVDSLSGRMEKFDDNAQKSLAEIQADNESRMSNLTKFQKRLETLRGGFNQWFEDLYGPNAAVWGWLDQTMTELEDLSVSVDKFVGDLKVGISSWGDFVRTISTTDILDPFRGDRQVISTGHEGKTPEERVTFYKRQFETIANRMAAAGASKETVSRYRRESQARIREMAAKEGVPETSAPLFPVEEIAETTKATKEVGTKMDRLIQLQEDVLRMSHMSRLDAQSNPSINRAAAASRVVSK